MRFVKYRQSKLFVLKLLVLFALFSQVATAQEKTFRWFDDEDYKPYIYKDEQGKPQGIFKELMEEIFKRLNVPLHCELYPWKRTQVFVKSGLADGMVTVATKKRLETMVHTDPLVSSGEKIFARKDNPKIEQIKQIKTIEQMRDFRVVEVIGAGWSEEKFKDLPHVYWAPKLSSALYMLANGRADIYVMNEFSGIEIVRTMLQTPSPFQENFKKIIVCPNTLEKIDYTLLINKNSPWANLVPKINQILEQMKQDGTYEKIMGRYLKIELP